MFLKEIQFYDSCEDIGDRIIFHSRVVIDM